MPDVLKDLSTARIERSRDCLREAKLLLDNGEYRGAANRAYYAGDCPGFCVNTLRLRIERKLKGGRREAVPFGVILAAKATRIWPKMTIDPTWDRSLTVSPWLV